MVYFINLISVIDIVALSQWFSEAQIYIRFILESLPGPNRAWLLVVYVIMPRPVLSLYGIIYVTWYISNLP